MRGEYMNRLYQPVFISLVCIASRLVYSIGRTGWMFLFVASLAQAGVVFSGILDLPKLQLPYERFYPHGEVGQYTKNIGVYGKYPLGLTGKKTFPNNEDRNGKNE